MWPPISVFAPVKTKTFPVKKPKILPVKKKTCPWKNWKKYPWKNKNCPWNFFPENYPVKNKNCEKQKFPVKKNQNCCPWKRFFSREKTIKNHKITREKKSWAWKIVKKGKKCPWKKKKLPVKKLTKRPKMAFTGNFFFHGEKKKTLYIHNGSENYCLFWNRVL